MTNGKENRRSFRISESALLQYEILGQTDFENGLDRWNVRSGTPSCVRSKVLDLDSRLNEVMYRVKNDTPAAYSALELLNEKMSLVLELLPEFSQFKQALADQPAQICELSTEGMIFGCKELLRPQTKLLLRFLLVSDSRFFETFCRVIRNVDEVDIDTGPHNYRVAVEFHEMRTADREILIQHLFSKQSESLRLRRKQSKIAS